MPPQLLTVSEAAGVLRLSTREVYRLIKARKLSASRLGLAGGRLRVEESEVRDYLRRSTSSTSTETTPLRFLR